MTRTSEANSPISMPCNTSISSTPSNASTPNAHSVREARRTCFNLRAAMMCHTAWMISAASTASGKAANNGVRNRTVTIVTTQVTRFAT